LLHDRHEENEWDHKISAEVKEGSADCIRMDEVRAVLKKIKRHKTPGLSGLVAEMKNVADWKCVVTVWIAANIKYVADWKCVVTV